MQERSLISDLAPSQCSPSPPYPTEPAGRATAAGTQMQLSPTRVWAWGQGFQKQQDSSQHFFYAF